MAHHSGTVMTIRVYKIRDGRVTEDTGVKTLQGGEEIDVTSNYPPCGCPGHRQIRQEMVRDAL